MLKQSRLSFFVTGKVGFEPKVRKAMFL
jgi:hypothetical protein